MLGCFLSLAGWLAVSYAYYRWFDTVFDPPGGIIGALVAGFATWCCVGSLLNAWKAWGDGGRIRRALAGEEFRDGKLVAVCGEIQSTGEVMLAPFSGTQCVICEYELFSQAKLEQQQSSKHKQKPTPDYCGFMMTPASIQTRQGEVRLLGFPQLDKVSDNQATRLDDASRAYLFLQSQPFEDRTGLRIVTVVSLFGELWTDDDGFVDKHLRLTSSTLDELFPSADHDASSEDDDEEIEPDDEFYAEAEKLSEEDFDRALEAYQQRVREERRKLRETEKLAHEASGESAPGSAPQLTPEGYRLPPAVFGKRPRLIEKRVLPGQKVCVIGIYNELHRGLRPTSKSGSPNRLYIGDPAQLATTFLKDARGYFFGSIIAAVIIHAIILLAMFIYTHSDEVRRDRLRDAENAVRNDNIEKIEALYRRGYDLNTPSTWGETHLMQVKTVEMARWLIEHGANVNAVREDGQSALTFAASSGNVELARLLLEAGADPSPRHKEWNSTPLSAATAQGDQPMIDLLRKHGAKE